jgi:hypothetical protein
MDDAVGRLPSAPGYSAKPEPVPVSAADAASIPSARSRAERWREFDQRMRRMRRRKSPPFFLQKSSDSCWRIQYLVAPKKRRFSAMHRLFNDPPRCSIEYEGYYNGWPGDSRGWMRFGSAREALDFFRFATGVITMEEYHECPHEKREFAHWAMDERGELYPLKGYDDPAQAIEARSGQTACGLDPKGESAVANGDAP